MWENGSVRVNGTSYEYNAKVYGEGSEYGINGGRVSKLYIRRNGESVCVYDRWWATEPVDADARKAYHMVVKMYA